MNHTDTDTGGAAFPVHPEAGCFERGMTLRDYFAGQALAGMNNIEYNHFEIMADDAYKIADAMLKAREGEIVRLRVSGGCVNCPTRWSCVYVEDGITSECEKKKAREEAGHE